MLKHLYKTFIISIISGNLAFAQGVNGTTTTDANGTITATQNYQFQKIEDQDMLASITMLAAGFITGRMIASYRPVTMDVMIAGAGGAAFVAGEIISNVKFKGKIDEMTIAVEKKTDGTVNEQQMQRLQDLKKSYEEAMKTTKTKKTLQLAAAAAFGAGAVAATYLAFTENSQILLCRKNILLQKPNLASCSASGATGVTASEAAACTACTTQLEGYEKTLDAYIAQRATPARSAGKDVAVAPTETTLNNPATYCGDAKGGTAGAVGASMATYCGKAVLTAIDNQTQASLAQLIKGDIENNFMRTKLGLPAQYMSYENQQSNENIFLSSALSLLIPKAEASWLPLLGLGAATAGAFFLITGTTATELDMMMFVPRNRAIAFGLLAGLAFMASKSSDNVIKKLEENIKKIDDIIADLNKMALGTKAQKLATQQVAIKTVNPVTNQAIIPFATVGSASTQCMSSSSTSNCTSTTDQLKNMPGFSNLPTSFQDVALQSTKLGDGLSGTTGLTGSTLAGADALGGKQAAIAGLLKDREAALDKLTKGNIQKDQKNLLDRMNRATKKALEQKGITAAGMMASIGTNPISASGAAAAVAPTATELKKTASAAGGVVNLAAPADKSLELDFKDHSQGDLAMAETGTGSTPVYDIPENQINGDNGLSLFEMISNRYLKSGYPKLLEEVQPVKK